MSEATAQHPLRIVVGVSGGIAAYKAVTVVRQLVQLGHNVEVIATPAALQFVGAPTFAAISHHPVRTEVFENIDQVQHVALGQHADVVAIVPATANTLARMAAGFADDLLTTTVLAAHGPVVVAPAMHTEMWEHPATQANMQRLCERGVVTVGPVAGALTGEDAGMGRMADPADIVASILTAAASVRAGHAAARRGRDLTGHRILITAGGTREAIDPVRYIGNRSSGKQGVAIAARALARGADVTLIAAHIDVPVPPEVRVVRVSSAAQLAAAATELAPKHDIIVMAAAVADYRPERVAENKIKKESTGDTLTLTFTKNPDVLRGLVDAREPGQLIVGFAAETEADDETRLRLGREKIQRKGADLLVLNRVGWDAGFNVDETAVQIINLAGTVVAEGIGDKMSVADIILDVLAAEASERA